MIIVGDNFIVIVVIVEPYTRKLLSIKFFILLNVIYHYKKIKLIN